MPNIPFGGSDPSGTGYLTLKGSAVIPFGGDDPSGPGYLVLGAPPIDLKMPKDRDWKGNLIHQLPQWLQSSPAPYTVPQQLPMQSTNYLHYLTEDSPYLRTLPSARIQEVTFSRSRSWFWQPWRHYIHIKADFRNVRDCQLFVAFSTDVFLESGELNPNYNTLLGAWQNLPHISDGESCHTFEFSAPPVHQKYICAIAFCKAYKAFNAKLVLFDHK